MNRLPRLLPGLVLLAGLGLLSACGDDDDTTGPDDQDTTAPEVLVISPADGAIGVAVAAPVSIAFNEAMDPDSADGGVTLSSGQITGMSWTDAQTLVVMHTAWAEGATVTMTVGTGLADAAGNALAAARSSTFYTQSSDLVFVASNPADGAVDVNRSLNIQLLFSAAMDLASLETAVTITDDTRAEVPFTVSAGADLWVVLDPTGDLAAASEITVSVSTDARDLSARNLAAAATLAFTTGADIDDEPPTILGVVPADGSTIPDDTSALQITFSEPVDPATFDPLRINGEVLDLLFGIDGFWSGDRTTFTLPLPTPLPAGLPLDVTLGDYADFAGNVQTTPTRLQLTVAGAADYYPLVDGRRYLYIVNEANGQLGDEDPDWEGTFEEYVQYDAQANGIFHRGYYDAGYTTAAEWDILRKTAAGLELLGFHEGFEEPVDILFDEPITYVKLPLAVGTWTDETTATVDGEEITLVGVGTVVSQDDLPWVPAGPDHPEIFWKNVWLVTIEHENSAGTTMIEAGVDTLWLAPTVGIVKFGQYSESYDEGNWTRDEGWLVPEFMD